MTIEVRRMAPDERDRVVALTVEAFRADPQVRWWFHHDATYPAHAAAFFGGLADLRSAGGEVWVADGGDAVAMWTPPGGNLLPPDAQRDFRERMGEALPQATMRRIRETDEAVERCVPRGPHWYLGVLATAPARRGQGLAYAVVEPVLASADRTGRPVVLETATDANVRYYTRLGFARTATLKLPGGGPDLYVMVRTPQDEDADRVG